MITAVRVVVVTRFAEMLRGDGAGAVVDYWNTTEYCGTLLLVVLTVEETVVVGGWGL